MPTFSEPVIPPGFTEADVTSHDVITEWRAEDPAADTFAGTQREILRVGQVVSASLP